MTIKADHVDSAAVLDRRTIGAWTAVRELVRERLAQAGIDPNGIGALSLAPHPDPLPASAGLSGESRETNSSRQRPRSSTPRPPPTGGRGALSETQAAACPIEQGASVTTDLTFPDSPAASGAGEQIEGFALLDGDGLAGMFAAKIGDIAQRYEGGAEPDFPNASLAELFAWCVSRRADRASHQPLDKPASDDQPRMNQNNGDGFHSEGLK